MSEGAMPLDDAGAGSTKSQRRFQLLTRKPQGDIQGNKGHIDKWTEQYFSEASKEEKRRLELRDQLCNLANGKNSNIKAALEKLLSQNPDINATHNAGRTVLHIAALEGSEDLLNLLLHSTDVKLNAQDEFGMTALHLAVVKKQIGCIMSLLVVGANTEIADNKGHCPRHYAYALGGKIKDIFRKSPSMTLPQITKEMSEKPSLTSKPPAPVEDTMDGKLADWAEGSFLEPAEPVKWERLSVWDLIYSNEDDALERRKKHKKWIHLPATSQLWAQDLVRSIFAAQQKPKYEAERACRFIYTVFEEANTQGPCREFFFKREAITRQELKNGEMVAIVLPIIDIDRLSYVKQAKEVRGAKSNRRRTDDKDLLKPMFRSMWSPQEEEVHIMRTLQLCAYHDQPLPLTLDQSYHGSLDRKKLSELDSDQLLTKYLMNLKKNYSPHCQNFPRTIEAWDTPPIRDSSPPPPARAAPEPVDDEDAREKSNETDVKNKPDEIIVIPYFWMFKIDEDTVLTLYPGRWDKTSEADLHTHLLNQVAEDKELHHTNINMIQVAEHIIKACVSFEALTYFKWKKVNIRDYLNHKDIEVSYMTAYADSIGQLFVDATELYHQFNRALGVLSIDSRTFYKSVKDGTKKLIDIDDIIGEIDMIKRIQIYQVEAMRMFSHVIWGDLEDWRYGGNWRYKNSKPYEENEWEGRYHVLRQSKRGEGYAVSDGLLPFPGTLGLLEADAARVRSMITTILDLRHREATIENALSGSAQATMLFIFTVITVLFAPLAFVCSLLALPIQDLPSAWVKEPLAGVFGYATLATVGLCAIMWAIYKTYTHVVAKRRNRPPRPPVAWRAFFGRALKPRKLGDMEARYEQRNVDLRSSQRRGQREAVY